MGFTDTGERLWRGMPIPERTSLLKDLAEARHQEPTWGGLSLEAVSQIRSFDDLPSELRGQLIMAMTEEGFSVMEKERVEGVVQEMVLQEMVVRKMEAGRRPYA